MLGITDEYRNFHAFINITRAMVKDQTLVKKVYIVLTTYLLFEVPNEKRNHTKRIYIKMTTKLKPLKNV